MVDIFCILEYIERNGSGDYTHWNILIISYEICISFPTDEYCSVVYTRADKIVFIIFILFSIYLFAGKSDQFIRVVGSTRPF